MGNLVGVAGNTVLPLLVNE